MGDHTLALDNDHCESLYSLYKSFPLLDDKEIVRLALEYLLYIQTLVDDNYPINEFTPTEYMEEYWEEA